MLARLLVLLLLPSAAIAGVDVTPKLPPLAQAAAPREHGEPAIGRVLAQTWCSSCHAIEGPHRAGDTAPPFSGLRRAGDESRLRGWLHDPHPPMQGIALSRQQVEDIVAYLRSVASD